MKYAWLIAIMSLLCQPCLAQRERVVIRFMDAERSTPVTHVIIRNRAGEIISGKDSAGYVVLPLPLSRRNFIAMAPGYKPDTISEWEGTIYLRPLSATLKEAVIRNTNVSKLLRFSNEYVADYEPMGDKVLVATYSGNNGSHAKLFVIDKEGDVLSTRKLPAEPLSLYKGCTGRTYCVCKDRFYPLTMGDTPRLESPYDIKLLDGLMSCEQCIAGNLYYKMGDRNSFTMKYGMIAKGDSVFRPFMSFEERDVAEASADEWMEIMALLEQISTRGIAARKQLTRLSRDKGSYAHIDMPLVTRHDTLVIFDFFKKKLLWFNTAGERLGDVAIGFPWSQAQRFGVLKDAATDRVYIRRYDDKQAQTLEELDIHTGKTGAPVNIVKPLAERVMVHNGDVYFLWQDAAASATRQLYIQRSVFP